MDYFPLFTDLRGRSRLVVGGRRRRGGVAQGPPAAGGGQWLAIAATDDRAVNREVWSEGSLRGLLVNSVDDPASSSFIVPAIVDRSPLVIAISAGGTAPVLARRRRQ